MSDAAIWTTIAGLALVTYAIRFSFLGLLARRDLPEGVVRALGFVPVTVLPALVAPMLLPLGADRAVEPATLAAGIAAFAAGALLRNVLAGILGGIAGFAVATLLA